MRSIGADRWVRDRLIAATLVLFAARLVLSLLRSGPVLFADEIGYLTNARVLAGGVSGQLTHAPFYRGGYSLLLSPLLRLAASPTVTYHLVLALNAALAASLPLLLYLLLTRRAHIPPRAALWPAVAGAAYPSVTIFSQAAFSENALLPLTCVWLLCAGGLLAVRDSRQATLWAGATGASAAVLWAVHGRMITVFGLTLFLLGWLAARRRAPPVALATGLIVAGAGAYGTHLLDAFLVSHNYGGHSISEANDRLSALLGFHALLHGLENLAGQLWYLVVSTFGLVGVVAGRALQDRRAAVDRDAPDRIAILPWTLALAVLLLLVSAGSFPARTRPDMLIYGRYVEVVTPPLVALGLALLGRGRRSTSDLRLTAATLGLLTGLVAVVRALSPDSGTADRWNVAALPFLTFHLGPGVLLGAGVVGVAGALLLVRTAVAKRIAPGLAMLALFLPVLLYSEWNPVLHFQRAVYPSGWTSPQSVAQRLGIRSVAYDLADYDVVGLYVVQWFLPRSHLLLFDGRRADPPSRYVLGGVAWGRQHPADAATILWRAAGRNEVLWSLRRPSGNH